ADYTGPQLRRYAASVVNMRIMQLLATTMMKTYFFLDMWLQGIQTKNPYPLMMAARSQLEAFAVVWDTVDTIQRNAGVHPDSFAQRVKVVDEALINAIHGTRSAAIVDIFANMRLSRLRPPRQNDVDLIRARNVLTRIDKLSKTDIYPDCRIDYD